MPGSTTKKMKAEAKCPVCRAPLRFSGGSECYTALPLDEDRPSNVTRVFAGECTHNLAHGIFFHTFWGNHVTMDERKFGQMFPKAVRREIQKHLTVEERRAFNLMVHGKRTPDWKQLEAWRNLATRTAR
jgi:hypothetical protein